MGRPSTIKVGNRYGRLLVLEVLPGEGAGRHAIVVCLCDCGKTKEVRSHILGKVKSCGCAQRDSTTWERNPDVRYPWTLPEGEAASRSLYSQYRRGAERRGLVFDLTLEQFKELAVQNCTYCGVAPSREYNGGRSKTSKKPLYNGAFICNGIDRADSNLGYTLINSVSCCSECNFAKHSRSAVDFIAHAHRIASHCPVPANDNIPVKKRAA